MKAWQFNLRAVFAGSAILLGVGTAVAATSPDAHGYGYGEGGGANYQVDPSWPKTLPYNWLVGQVGGIAVDRRDNIWILQRARTLTNDEAWATEAIAYRCEDGTLFDAPGMCSDGSEAVPIDGNGHPRPEGQVSSCCVPAPAVMQFDRHGNLLRAWGGPADPGFIGPHAAGEPGCDPSAGCQWPAGEHGIYVDHNDYVYLAGNGTGNGTCGGEACPWAGTHGADSMVLKFSSDGTFLYQIGDPGVAGADSNDTEGAANGTPQPFRPADMEVDPETNQLYIADGYGNHRVLVVDAETGMYIKHWGGYGQNPVTDVDPDAPSNPIGADPNFKNPVHCVRIVGDLIYVCDRVNNRIQVFNKHRVGEECANPDMRSGKCGFVKEEFIAVETLGNGSTWDLDTSPDPWQSCLFNPDGTNQKVWVLARQSLQVVDTFGEGGRSAGQFHWVHNLATDSQGNIYTAEVDTGKRAQKFLSRGRSHCFSSHGGW